MRPVSSLGKVAFLYSEGGVLGGIHMPFARAALERGIFPVYVGGASAGTMNGAPIAEAHTPAEMLAGQTHAEAKWAEINEKGSEFIFDFSLRKIHFFGDGLLENTPLARLLDGFDPKKCIASPTQFEFSVFNHTRKQYEILSNRHPLFAGPGGNPLWLPRAIVASASVTAAFPRVQIAGSWYSDGDFIQVMPAVDAGCDTIFVFFCYPRHESPQGDLMLRRLVRATRVKWGMNVLDKYEVLRDRSQKELDIALRYIGQPAEQEMSPKSFLQKVKSRTPFFRRSVQIVPVFPEKKDIPASYTGKISRPGDIARAQKNVRPRIERILDTLLT